MIGEVTIAANVAQAKILKRPGAATRQRQVMFDSRRLPDVMRLSEAHWMAAPPTIVAVPFPQLGNARLAFLPLVPPAGHEIFGDLLGHIPKLSQARLPVGKDV